jgi:hypothetical protein
MAKDAQKDKPEGRPDKRRPLMLYMRPALKDRLRMATFKSGKHAYEIVEDAVEMWLAAQKKKK